MSDEQLLRIIETYCELYEQSQLYLTFYYADKIIFWDLERNDQLYWINGELLPYYKNLIKRNKDLKKLIE